MSPARFRFSPMTEATAEAIASWHYEAPYDFYDMSADPQDLEELLTVRLWGTTLFAVHDVDELVGFVSVPPHGEIGLGLRPDRTGHGLGEDFVRDVLAFAEERLGSVEPWLKVAAFNERAIRVYERVGFERTKTYVECTNDGDWEFVEMRMRSSTDPR